MFTIDKHFIYNKLQHMLLKVIIYDKELSLIKQHFSINYN